MLNVILALLIARSTLTSTSLEPSILPEDPTFLYKDERSVLLNVPYVNQIEDLPEAKKKEIGTTACGPASINMLLKYYGKNINLYDVIEKLPSDVYEKGKRFYNLPKAPDYFNFKSASFENSYKNIFAHLTRGEPIILNVQNYDGITGHAVVVVGMKNYNGIKADALIVHDPYRSSYREFNYINEQTLEQPEGYTLSIGILKPFIIETDKLFVEKIKFKILNEQNIIA